MKIRMMAPIVLAALAFAVLPGGAQAQRKGGDVVIAITQAPPSLDAHITSAQASRNINLHIFETLYARDENASPVPEIAEGVKVKVIKGTISQVMNKTEPAAA